MRVVYEAENSIDAHLARGWLEAAGLSPWIRGEYLSGAMGELPAHGLLAVCVPDEEIEAAGEVLAELAEVREQSIADAHAEAEADEGVDGQADDDGWMRA